MQVGRLTGRFADFRKWLAGSQRRDYAVGHVRCCSRGSEPAKEIPRSRFAREGLETP